ncbi:hypothetical protein [Aureispira anguillae]|uniref:DUF4332 domain-containing protein n=1 Tax=Aureispira anguillae TaxID=2864201 RepID=A0A915YC14_9BACT|nr:hypothetical protein [Aureispira anguillae]BDS10322.1 hypothetical protein AsAng_0010300 [Aureispira anguillae]
MSCWIMVLGFMIGAAVMGYLLAWFLQPVDETAAKPSVKEAGNKDELNKSKEESEKTQKELDKMKKRYDELYDSKLDVDTALVAAESTLDGLKLDYERLERDMSGNNNRHKELQADFDNYKDKKESEIKELRIKTKKANDGYETVKFQLAKSNRINEKLQEGLLQLKEENENLSAELEEAKEDMEVVNASMTELRTDYKELKDKAEDYNSKLEEWQDKYKNLNLSLQTAEDEKTQLSKTYENYQITTGAEIEKLGGHLKTLQAQLEESTQYANEYADAYTHLEANQEELEAERKAALDELAHIQEHFKGVEEDYELIKGREEVLEQRFSSLQEKHSDLEDAYHNTVEEKQNLETAYQAYKESTIEQYSELEKEAKTWVEKLEASNVEMSQHKEKAAELEQNKKQLMLELEKARKRYEKELSLSGGEFEALNDTFEGLKERYFEVNKELSSTKLEKERINYEHETFQEQVLTELELVRGENKKLSKSLTELKAEKRLLELSKDELAKRVKNLEETGLGSTPDQAKLIKIITRLRKNVEEQQEQFEKEKNAYQTKIETLELQLQEHSNSTTVQQLMAEEKKDNLRSIAGLGQVAEETLNDFGIYSFQQLANLSEENKALLSQIIESPTQKITQWVEKAQEMAEKV